MKDFAVVLVTYNAESTVENAINGALHLVPPPTQIILVDDNSQDQTVKLAKIILANFENHLLITNEINLGQSYSRNLGVINSNCEVIIFMDDDDVSYPNRSLVHLEKLSGHYDLSFVSTEKNYGPNYRFFAVNSEIGSSIQSISQLIRHMVIGSPLPNGGKVYSPSCSLAVKRESFQQIQGFDQDMRRLEDIDFVCRALSAGLSVSWSSEVCVRRFDTLGGDKGAVQNANGELKVLRSFRDYLSKREYLVSHLMTRMRRYYFSKNYPALIILLPISTLLLILSPSKLRSIILRIIHDARRRNA
jgi:glycosyltransferase involved in cell wall biosynthesis